ncbi:MAG: 2TM domain-containing protein [Lutibacter sp.]|nr:2TM domain-containing protein [Lutibacter sp.]
MNEQHELYENARELVKQKKHLYFHFVIFLIGSVFLIVLNKFLKIGETIIENWFVWAIILWLFFLVLHFVHVFITNRFMGKEWERKQIDKLIIKQELKIAKLEIESEQYDAELKNKENSQNKSIQE